MAPKLIGTDRKRERRRHGVTATGSLIVTHKTYLSEVAHEGFEKELWIYARKATGAGTLTIRPAIVWGRSPVGCTASGL